MYEKGVFVENCIFCQFLASDTSERQPLWVVAQILSARSDFTGEVDFFQFICDFIFTKITGRILYLNEN